MQQTVDAGDVAAQVHQLRRMRREAAWWRYGAAGVVAVTVITSLVTLRNSVQALATPGPSQDQFASALGTGLQENVYPVLQDAAGRTLTELRPQVMDAFQKMGDRAPEFADASMTELNALQNNISTRSEQTLNESFSAQLKEREPKIRAMFPNATEEKVQTLIDNMSSVGAERIANANERLFSKHLNAMNGIVASMTTIQDSENVTTKGDKPKWELAIATLDILREDLKSMAPADVQASSTLGTASSAAKPAAKGGTR